jgi:hypothetical protein
MQPDSELTRYLAWAGIVAIGALLAVIDRRWPRWRPFGMLLIAAAVGGLVITRASPFTFGGGDHFMEGVILSAASALALAGYSLAIVWQLARRHLGGRRRR